MAVGIDFDRLDAALNTFGCNEFSRQTLGLSQALRRRSDERPVALTIKSFSRQCGSFDSCLSFSPRFKGDPVVDPKRRVLVERGIASDEKVSSYCLTPFTHLMAYLSDRVLKIPLWAIAFDQVTNNTSHFAMRPNCGIMAA